MVAVTVAFKYEEQEWSHSFDLEKDACILDLKRPSAPESIIVLSHFRAISSRFESTKSILKACKGL